MGRDARARAAGRAAGNIDLRVMYDRATGKTKVTGHDDPKVAALILMGAAQKLVGRLENRPAEEPSKLVGVHGALGQEIARKARLGDPRERR